MAEVRLECPHCHRSFPLTETLAAPVVEATRRKLEQEFDEKEEALEARRRAFENDERAAAKARKDLEKERAGLAKEKERIEEQVAERVEEEKAAIEREAARKAKQKYDEKLGERDEENARLEEALKERDAKLAESRRAEVDFRRKQRELDEKLKAADADVEKRATELLTVERETARKAAEEKLKQERVGYERVLEQREAEKAELEEALKAQKEKLDESRKAEADYLKKQRDLDEKLKGADADVERRVTAALGVEQEKAKRDAEAAVRLRLAEKDRVIENQKQQLAEAQRKLEQGSEQLQGEIQELDIGAALRAAFDGDIFERVPKGQSGADLLQRVLGPSGQACGTILWEIKRTSRWNDDWLGKLRQDQREIGAELAVIASQAMPDNIETFEDREGVWIVAPACAVALAMALRAGLINTAAARTASQGQQTKMALLYQYLTGPQFKQRVEGLLEGYRGLREDLETEKRAMNVRWKAREKQLDIVMLATTGMYGDLQGIAGKTMPEIEGLELNLLEDSDGRSTPDLPTD